MSKLWASFRTGKNPCTRTGERCPSSRILHFEIELLFGIVSRLITQLNIGLIGGGTVGGGLYHALQRNGGLISSRLGVKLCVSQVAVRNLLKPRPVDIPQALLTTDWRAVVENPETHIVCELMGGLTTAKAVVTAALKLGKPVVTANKALLSAYGEELFELAKQRGGNLYYEASVAGGIPIIKVLREALIGNRITRLYGIVNGTCNYILTRMKLEGADFGAVLADAQQLGFAEAEPSLDVDGHDAAQKIGILASLAHGFWVPPERIHTEGIREVTPLDIQFAAQLGYTIKLIAMVKKFEAGKSSKSSRIQVSITPTLVPNSHVLANVNHVFNAILVRGDVVGDTLYYGRGAGQDATASSVLSDIADAALDLRCHTDQRVRAFVPHERDGKVVDIDDTVSRYYLRLSVIDKPGTLARIAALLGQSKIGISSVIQPEGHEGESVPLILMIHDASFSAMRKALTKIARLSVIKGAPVLFRVENFE